MVYKNIMGVGSSMRRKFFEDYIVNDKAIYGIYVKEIFPDKIIYYESNGKYVVYYFADDKKEKFFEIISNIRIKHEKLIVYINQSTILAIDIGNECIPSKYVKPTSFGWILNEN